MFTLYIDDIQLLIVLINFVLFFSSLLLIVYFYSQQKTYDVEKTSPYECGFMPFDFVQRPFDVRFYRVAIIFMLFDVEVIFLFPWAAIALQVEMWGFCVFFMFNFFLTIGFFYEWITGALDVL